MLTTCRNALSVLDLLVKVIGSAVVASTFSSWTAGGVWGVVVVSTIIRTIQNWERQEGVTEYFRNENKGYLQQLQGGILSEKIASSCISANNQQIIEKEKQITEQEKRDTLDKQLQNNLELSRNQGKSAASIDALIFVDKIIHLPLRS